jgi:hypothetical protein
MSGLWTPDGERPAPKRDEPDADAVPVTDDAEQSAPDEEEAAMLEELAQAERQLLAAAVEDVVANHCYGLFQLAALHLGQQPPHLVDSQLAIDALGAIVETLGDRLGQSAVTLREGLTQLRLAYVQIAGATSGANGSSSIGTEDAPPVE